VPTDAGDETRQKMKSICVLAGLNPLRIINEATAALTAYSLAEQSDDQLSVVVDVGTGGARCSLLSTEDGIYELLETKSDPACGGDAATDLIASHCLGIARMVGGTAVSRDTTASSHDAHAPQALHGRLNAAKEKLCAADTASGASSLVEVALPSSTDASQPHCIPVALSYDHVCTATAPIAEQLRSLVLSVIATAAQRQPNITLDSIPNIVLAGNGFHLPGLAAAVTSLFPSATVFDSIPFAEVVSRGCALTAAILASHALQLKGSATGQPSPLPPFAPLPDGAHTAG